ncbi:hypothetical protein SAMN05444159_6253 [Bradyrhizobium lablabi]|uniref:DUF4145 domain-containing protein n=1 Tax=Bradyrhizobium lablabi TaxID=722472 RepID=A0A1M7BR61_9BRAD|nr:hypothetical protein [Bradyrhizobium lablabi]SHL57427.1 hypothetical protein SAMN05444159_6253 [Bradyrhizobium lablabi]
MKSQSERYKADLTRLVWEGKKIAVALQYDCDPEAAKKTGLKKEDLPDARQAYQAWYSEALACVTQLLPDRVEDFISYYKPLKPRKSVGFANYTMSDYLIGSTVYDSDSARWIVPANSALSAIFNQYKIVETISNRFESTLFDIRALVHADLLDDELAAADELNKQGFSRGAGAIAGVVLEAHLAGISETHKIKLAKNATISTLNDALKKADILDTATWRFIQHLGDIRNKCDHKADADPTRDEVKELVDGVRKITKTVF